MVNLIKMSSLLKNIKNKNLGFVYMHESKILKLNITGASNNLDQQIHNCGPKTLGIVISFLVIEMIDDIGNVFHVNQNNQYTVLINKKEYPIIIPNQIAEMIDNYHDKNDDDFKQKLKNIIMNVSDDNLRNEISLFPQRNYSFNIICNSEKQDIGYGMISKLLR